ncbi:MAG: ComF family protein [Pseudomonadota bacterium]
MCPGCGDIVMADGALCAPCWSQTPFIMAPFCDTCGVQLPGMPEDTVLQCDDCMASPPPWAQGRAALMYRDTARSMVLALKHGDRHDLITPLGLFMAQAAAPLMQDTTLFVPVPLHVTRLIKRRYNQAAVLAHYVAQHYGRPVCQALKRRKRTVSLEGKTRDERYATLQGAICANPKHHATVAQKHVILVDDVMTSGATLSTCTDVIRTMGASAVSVLVLARVGKAV